MLHIMLMLFLLIGFFGLFVGLVFFAEGVISPEPVSQPPTPANREE